MSREPEIDQLFVRLCRMVTNLDGRPTTGWELIEGIEDHGQPRTQWVVMDGRQVIAPLGYTRRQVLASLMSMCSILAVLLGA